MRWDEEQKINSPTEELIRQLMAFGLNASQARSATAEKITNFYQSQAGGAAILDEAKRKVEMMEEMCDSLRSRYEGIVNSMDTISQNLQALTEAQEKAEDLEDSRAKDTIALYSALISVAMKSGADGASAVENAGYILYAYLGGQAARNVNFDTNKPTTAHVQPVAGRRF